MAEHFCEVCNSEVPQGALACPVCGTPVSKPARSEADAAQVPAAPPEYVDLAEVNIPSGESAQTPQIPEEAPPLTEDIPLDIGTVADQSVAPGIVVPPEQVELTNDHTGGYKEAMSGPSVAGAGAQTADDPFGLQITETAPPVAAEEEPGFDFNRLKNIAMLIFSLLLAAGAITFGIWFFAIREPVPKVASPEASIEGTLTRVFSGSLDGVEKYANPGSEFVQKTMQIFAPYRELGMLTLKKLETETNTQGDMSMVTITKLTVQLTSPKGNETLDALSITTPYLFPSIIRMEKKGDKWVITK